MVALLTEAKRADDIRALGGADVVQGGGGDDEVRGGGGADRISVGQCGSFKTFAGGDDVISVAERCSYQGGGLPPPEEIGDYVDCGPGRDVVRNVGRGDEITEDCERKNEEAML